MSRPRRSVNDSPGGSNASILLNRGTNRWRAFRGPPLRAYWSVLAAVGALGCVKAAVPCRSPGHCPAGSECLANRCVALGDEPVPTAATRRVVEATRIAVVRPDSGPSQSAQGIPSSVTFGGGDGRGEQLLLAFPMTWTDLDVGAAFLLLTPAPGAGPSGADVQIEVTLAGSAWTPGTLRRAPSSEGSASPGLARMRPPSVLRVDVTELLRQLAAQSRGHDSANERGLLVRARRPSERGATYLTGASGGTPRLDVYGRPRLAQAPE